jgi:hypothetical protein
MSINFPATTTSLLVNTWNTSKIVYLPSVSTVGAGKLFYIKDICGNAAKSTIYISTTGLDKFEQSFPPSTLYGFLSTNFGSVLLAPDGGTNWMVLQNYTLNGVRKGSKGWNPTYISGLAQWLDAFDSSNMSFSSGQNISSWLDKSGKARNATLASGAGSVTFSGNGLTFSGSGHFSNSGIVNLLANTSFTIFIVETVNGGGFLFGDDNSNGCGSNGLHVGYRNTGNITFAFCGDDLEDYAISGSGVRRMWAFRLPSSSSSRTIRRNGSVDVTGNSNRLGSYTAPTIGRIFGGSNYSGVIHEIIVYVGDYTDSQIQSVEGYLAWKWGTQASLPSGHLYKNGSP